MCIPSPSISIACVCVCVWLVQSCTLLTCFFFLVLLHFFFLLLLFLCRPFQWTLQRWWHLRPSTDSLVLWTACNLPTNQTTQTHTHTPPLCCAAVNKTKRGPLLLLLLFVVCCYYFHCWLLLLFFFFCFYSFFVHSEWMKMECEWVSEWVRTQRMNNNNNNNNNDSIFHSINILL